MLSRIRPVTTINEVLLTPFSVSIASEDSTAVVQCSILIDKLGNYILSDKKPFISIDTSTLTSIETYAEMNDVNEDIPLLMQNALYLIQSNAMDEYQTFTFYIIDDEMYKVFYDTVKEIIRCNYNKREPSVLEMVAKLYYRLIAEYDLFQELTPAKILNVFNIKSQTSSHASAMFGLNVSDELGSKFIMENFSLENFYRLYLSFSERSELHDFLKIIKWDSEKTASVSALVDFFMEHQYPKYSVFRNIDLELVPTKMKLTDFLTKTSKRRKLNGRLSVDLFIEYLLGNKNLSTNDLKFEKHDMNQPLNHYYINSSHNTYLPGWQVNAKSAVEMYRQVLLAGCRCIELDCWDGPQSEPIITHGYALCSTISFQEVVKNIKKYAFKSSEYPVILSLENHCSLKMQSRMAYHLNKILGDLIQRKPFQDFPLEDGVPFPSLEQCKGKIFIKNNKIAKTSTIDVNQIWQKTELKESKSGFSSVGNFYQTVDIDDRDIAMESDDICADNLEMGKELCTPSTFMSPQFRKPTRSELSEVNDDGFNEVIPGTSDKLDVKDTSDELSDDLTIVNSVSTGSNSRAKIKLKDMPVCEAISSIDVTAVEASASVVDSGGNNLTLSASIDTLPESMTFSPGLDTPEKIELLLENSDHLSEANKKKLKSYLKKIYACRNEDDSAIYSELDSKGKIHPAMSDMVNYFRPCPFTTMASVLEKKFFLVCTSFNETAALQLEKNETINFVELNKRRLSRIYPKGGRYESTNYNPQTFWNVGCQMVALNFQTSDVPMQLNNAKFEVNNGIGYVLKPGMMVESSTHFDPHQLVSYSNVISLDFRVKILSAQFVSKKKISVYVSVELYGLNSDIYTQKTNPSVLEVTNNVRFNDSEEMVFKEIIYPPHVIVRFSIVDDSSKATLYQRCVHLESLEQGLRHIPMKKVDGRFSNLTTLCVIMDIRNSTSGENEAFANLLAAPSLGLTEGSSSISNETQNDEELNKKIQKSTTYAATELCLSFFTNLYGLEFPSVVDICVELTTDDLQQRISGMRDHVKRSLSVDKKKEFSKQKKLFGLKKKITKKTLGCADVSKKYKSAGDNMNASPSEFSDIKEILSAEYVMMSQNLQELHKKDIEFVRKQQDLETEQLTKAQQDYYIKSWKQCKKMKGSGASKGEILKMKKNFERDMTKNFYKEKSWLKLEHKRVCLQLSKRNENEFKLFEEWLQEEAEKVEKNAKLMKNFGYFG